MEQQIQQIFNKYLRTPQFQEIEHMPTQLYEFDTPMKLLETCLLIPYASFQKLYTPCINILKQTDNNLKQMAVDIILCFNGQNEKAWNFKRTLWQKLNIKRQLILNGALCMKFKKSTILYDFRINLIKRLDKNTNIEQLLRQQSKFIFKILIRFHRNYYCWTYRLKLFSHLLDISQNKSSLIELQRMLVKDYCDKNIHEYSGFWYLFQLLNSKGKENWREQQISWVTNLIKVYKSLYSQTEQGSKLYSLNKYKQWINKII